MTYFSRWPARAVALAVVLAVPLAGQVPAPVSPAQPPVYRTGIDLVTVDVTVLGRDGDPLDTLTADDFTLEVDGAPRPIASVRLVRTASASAPSVPAPSAPAPAAAAPASPPPIAAAMRRVFVVVVDRDNIHVGEGQAMLEAGARFIDGLPPEDRVAVWTLPDARDALRLDEDRQTLTARLRRAVGTFRPPHGTWLIGRDEAIRADEHRPGALDAIVARECYKQKETCPEEVAQQATELARDARRRTDATLGGLGGLVDGLAAIEGPKHVVLITGGPVRTFDNLGTIGDLATRAALARVTIHALQVADLSYQARTDQMRAMPAEIDQSDSAAYLLASTTGGLAITPATGTVGFARLSRDLSAGYMLAFETLPADRDGRVHQIQVKVRDRGWGSTLRARRSFRVESNAPAATSPAAPATPALGAPDPAEAGPATAPPEPVGTDPGDMADRLADYAEAFERDLAAVVAEERYVQIIHPWRGNPSGPTGEPALAWRDADSPAGAKKGGPIIARRQLLSDVLAVQVKGQNWITYRDVAEVDGEPVRTRTDRVRALFLSSAADRDDQFRRIAFESARYNIGDLRRELNLPTVTLSLLRRVNHHRFEFKRAKDETIDQRPCRVLTYRERVIPTIVATPNSGNIFISGRVWIDQADGRVRRTELRFDRGSQKRSSIRVDFGPLEGLAVLVPTSMWEWYEGADQLGRIGGDTTIIQGLATYANVRRFQVTTGEAVR